MPPPADPDLHTPEPAAAFRGARRRSSPRPSSGRPPFRKRVQRVRRWLWACAARIVVVPFLVLPFRLARPLAWYGLAPLVYAALARDARRNLDKVPADVLPAADRRRIARGVCWHTALVPVECAAWWRLGASFFDRYVDDTDARARFARFEREWPGGWIGVTGHIGNWELLGQWIHLRAARPYGGSVARRPSNPYMRALIERFRGRQGMTTLYRDEPPTRLLRLLAEGRGFGVVPDQDVSSLPGVFVPMLGRPAYTPIGPARLAVAANVPILVCVLLRRGERYVVELAEPSFPEPGQPKAAEVERLTRAWSAQLEAIVRAHPEQWPWFHDRWKTTPELLASRSRKRYAPSTATAEGA